MNLTASQFNERPRTKLGWWAIWLGVAFVVLFIANVVVFSLVADETFWRGTILPYYGPIMLLCGLAGGVVGLVAVFRKHEHSLLIWLAIFLGLFVVILTLNEFLQLLRYLQWI
jgi:hypothetical protein